MLPSVNILLQNGQIGGLIAFAEGVAGMVGTGVAVTGKIQLADPRLVFSLAEAEAQGITTADNPVAHRQVREFYAEAGLGRELYIMLVSDAVTQALMLDSTNASGVSKLLDFAQGRIRLLATFFAPDEDYTPTLTSALDGDVHTALTNGQATAVAYALQQKPFRFLVEGRNYTGVPATLTDLRTGSANRGAVVLGGSISGLTASVGLALGRLAKLPVHRKNSRVKDGAITMAAAFIGATAVELAPGIDLIHAKGYITFRNVIGRSGYFFTDDPSASPATDDYSFIARGRVIDKAAVLAYLTYINELNDEVLINPADGTLSIGVIKTLESLIRTQIDGSMTLNGEISGVSVFINPAQNIISTNKLIVVLNITPLGYLGTIEVQLGFINPANS